MPDSSKECAVPQTCFRSAKTSGPKFALSLPGQESLLSLSSHICNMGDIILPLKGFWWAFQVVNELCLTWYLLWGASSRNCDGLTPWHRVQGWTFFRTGQNPRMLLCGWGKGQIKTHLGPPLPLSPSAAPLVVANSES